MARQWQRLCNDRIRIVMEAEARLELSRSSQTAILLIAHELVLNAIKYAFPDGRSGTIRIRFRSDDNRTATLQVEDTGVGVETTCAADTTGMHHGQKLVRDLSLALGGTLPHGQASGGHDRRVTLCLPLAKGTRWPTKAN